MDIIRKSNRPYCKKRLYKIGLTFLEICYDSVVKDQGIVALFCNNSFFLSYRKVCSDFGVDKKENIYYYNSRQEHLFREGERL